MLEDENNNPEENNNNTENNETSIDEFLDMDYVKQDKIIVKKQKTKTITIIKPDNNSGMGETAPYSISKEFNWGAFLFNWLWGIKYRKYGLLLIPVLLFVPFGFLISIVLAFYAGIQGNQWAWAEIQYKDEPDFHNAQKAWVKAWFYIAGTIAIILTPFALYLQKSKSADEVSNISTEILNFSSRELSIPPEIYEKTISEDNHSQFLSSDKNIIYWVRPKNPHTVKNKETIEEMYNANADLKNRFILYPDLKEIQDKNLNVVDLQLEAGCKNSVCIDTWLYSSCNKGYCLINPRTRKYIKVRGETNVIPKAAALLNKWK